MTALTVNLPRPGNPAVHRTKLTQSPLERPRILKHLERLTIIDRCQTTKPYVNAYYHT